MEVIFMGTGTSQGVPMIACDCAVCRSTDPRNRRGRTSVHVAMDGLHVQVDAAPEFRLQCVACGVARVDLFVLTHGHADHIAGLDDLRRHCDVLGGAALPLYSTAAGVARVCEMFPYAVRERPEFRGYPAFRVAEMPAVLDLPQGTIRATILPHGRFEVLGLVFEERSTGAKFAYYTDCKCVPAEAMALARGAHAVALDGLRLEPHPTHMSIAEAVAVARELGVASAYLTHLTHTVDHAVVEAGLPPGVRLAYDGLRLELPGKGMKA
jgi:phosphoribosyl 1,2-cyclic phosphate phosphodiesterase